jgi:hypothetical protein
MGLIEELEELVEEYEFKSLEKCDILDLSAYTIICLKRNRVEDVGTVFNRLLEMDQEKIADFFSNLLIYLYKHIELKEYIKAIIEEFSKFVESKGEFLFIIYKDAFRKALKEGFDLELLLNIVREYRREDLETSYEEFVGGILGSVCSKMKDEDQIRFLRFCERFGLNGIRAFLTSLTAETLKRESLKSLRHIYNEAKKILERDYFESVGGIVAVALAEYKDYELFKEFLEIIDLNDLQHVVEFYSTLLTGFTVLSEFDEGLMSKILDDLRSRVDNVKVSSTIAVVIYRNYLFNLEFNDWTDYLFNWIEENIVDKFFVRLFYVTLILTLSPKDLPSRDYVIQYLTEVVSLAIRHFDSLDEFLELAELFGRILFDSNLEKDVKEIIRNLNIS